MTGNPTPQRHRLLLHLLSTRNLVGTLAALVGLVLRLTGVVDAVWPVVVTVLYVVGVLATPAPRPVDLHGGLDPERLETAMPEQLRRLRATRASQEVLTTVHRIHSVVGTALVRRDAFPTGPVEASVAARTVVDYLPKALESYLRLPRVYADLVRLGDGRTGRQALTEQLHLIESELHQVTDALVHGDTGRVLVCDRVLADRFATSPLRP